jgi:hypothetical protein
MAWEWFDWLIICLMIICYIVGMVMYRDQKKKLLLRVEDEMEIYKTITNPESGEEEFYYEQRKFLFQRTLITLIFIEVFKDYVISRAGTPLRLVLGDQYVLGWLLIVIGYPIILVSLGIFYFSFTQFRQQGIPCIAIKLEDKPTDRFGKLLPEEEVLKLLEKEKGHQIFKFYIYYDRLGRLRASTRNIIKMLNDSTDYIELTVPLSSLANINIEELGEYEELAKIIPVSKIIRKSVSYNEDYGCFQYDLYVWEYESIRVLKTLMQAAEDKEKQRTSFLKSLSFAHVFQRLSKEYDNSQNRLHQLEGSVPLVVDRRVAEKQEEIELQKGLITKTITHTDITDIQADERALQKAVVTSEQKTMDEIFYDGKDQIDAIQKQLDAEKKKRLKKAKTE